MDGSRLPSDARYVLLDKQLADLIDEMDNEDWQFLIELFSLANCECGCRGHSYVTNSYDRRRRRLFGKLRRKPATAT